jgi:hypothetical protein
LVVDGPAAKSPSAGETESRKSADKLRQGDIIKIEQGEYSDYQYGVVINADCDLQSKKLDGVIAYLPIYKFSVYLKRFWIPDFVRSELSTKRDEVVKLLPSTQRNLDEILVWAQTSPLDEVIRGVASVYQLKEKHVQQLTEKLEKIQMLSSTEDIFETFRKLCCSQTSPEVWTKKRLEEAKKAMGDGHFFVSEIIGVKELGHVIRMRRIYSIEADKCFTSEALQKSRTDGTGESAFRFAGFTSTYRYKIAQLFAQQFSRIGLPDDISELSKVALDELVEEITGVANV